MSGHPGYLRLLDEMRALHERKAADYGRDADPFANCRASAEFGIPAWVGVMVRANDKVHRVKSMILNGRLANESVDDSLLDLAAYALIALTLLREERELSLARWAERAGVPAGESTPAPRRRHRVYIAGPISKGDLKGNIDRATAAHTELMKAGFAPLCPHWSVYAKPTEVRRSNPHLSPDVWCMATADGNGMSHADWLGVDLAWVAAADALLRLPGESTGADQEVAEARRLNVPVFFSAAELCAHFKGECS
jgi:hypothetical protein